jgi:hypothetical protein
MPLSAKVMSSTINTSVTQSVALRPIRQCKRPDFQAFFGPEPAEGSWSEYSSTVDSETSEDRGFISQDDLDKSQDEYSPLGDSTEDDDYSIASSSQYNDTDSSDENLSIESGSQYDHTDGSDDDLSKIPPTPIRIISNASAAKKNKTAGSEPTPLDSAENTPSHRRAISQASR